MGCSGDMAPKRTNRCHISSCHENLSTCGDHESYPDGQNDTVGLNLFRYSPFAELPTGIPNGLHTFAPGDSNAGTTPCRNLLQALFFKGLGAPLRSEAIFVAADSITDDCP